MHDYNRANKIKQNTASWVLSTETWIDYDVDFFVENVKGST
jgi:hypothetical protein